MGVSWGFHKWGTPIGGWFYFIYFMKNMKNPIQVDDGPPKIEANPAAAWAPAKGDSGASTIIGSNTIWLFSPVNIVILYHIYIYTQQWHPTKSNHRILFFRCLCDKTFATLKFELHPGATGMHLPTKDVAAWKPSDFFPAWHDRRRDLLWTCWADEFFLRHQAKGSGFSVCFPAELGTSRNDWAFLPILISFDALGLLVWPCLSSSNHCSSEKRGWDQRMKNQRLKQVEAQLKRWRALRAWKYRGGRDFMTIYP